MKSVTYQFACGASICLLLSGCATRPLTITPVAADAPWIDGVGAPYSLRFTQYDVAITWRLTACNTEVETIENGVTKKELVQFAVGAEVAAEPKFPDDPSRRWLLDLWSLDGWLNTTDMAIDYEKGRFKSFNAELQDKSVDTAKAVLGAGVKIATFVAGGPLVGLDQSKVSATSKSADCHNIVEQAQAATRKAEGLTATLRSARRAVADAQARGASKPEVKRLKQAVRVIESDLEAATEELAKALKAVTFEEKLIWPERGDSAGITARPLPPAALAKWRASDWKDEAAGMQIDLALRAVGAGGKFVDIRKADYRAMDDQVALGRIPVRVARPGALIATLKGAGKADGEILNKPAAIIQAGDIIYVPIERRWPRSTKSGFGMDSDGYLTGVSHKQLSAPGQAVGDMLGQVADTADALTMTDLEKLKAENDALAAQKTNAELKATLAPPAAKSEYQLQLDAVNAELVLKKAQLELYQTNKALAEAGQ